MKLNKILVLFIIIVTLIISFENVYAEELETIEVEVKYFNGDRADFTGMKLLVYQDFDQSIFLEKKLEGNPDYITLPINHKYKIEVYANGIYANIAYIQSENFPKKINIDIPLAGGLQFEIFYKNGQTPIKGATVVLKSYDNSELRRGTTNDQGETLRYWIQSTTKQEDYYIAEVYLEDIFLTSYFPIKLQEGLATNQKIITDIPEIVEELITINLYTGTKKITSKDGDYKVILSNSQGSDVILANVNVRGDANFSSLKSGTYEVKIITNSIDEDIFWSKTNIHIIGDLNKFSIFKNSEKIIIEKTPEIEEETIEIEEEIKIDSCNCVAFRLDDVQDYWLNDVQIQIMETFTEKNTPLTIGIIASAFGNDQKITEFVKQNIEIDGGYLEVATRGIGLTPFTNYDKIEQNENLKESIDLIESDVNVRPKVFIPPGNRFNSDTLEVLEKNNITYISSSLTGGDSPPFEFKGEKIYRYPQITTTGKYNPSLNIFEGISRQQIISESIQGINNFGFSVISMSPQEFAIIENSTYVNSVNEEQIDNLIKIIDEFNEKGYKIVPIGKINSNLIVLLPEWIKNNAGWWSEGQIDDKTFVQGIEYLVQENIITVSEKSQTATEQNMPEWIKNNAGWWSEGQIDDKTFVQGIEYLVKNGIITY